MGFTSDLLYGIAERLQAAEVATWRPTGSYQVGETPIVMQSMPATPDRCVTLAAYDVASPLADHCVTGVQVRCRGTRDPRVVDDLTDDVRDALHGLGAHGPVELHGIHVALVVRNSSADLGPDGNGRFETTSNFYVTAARPSALLTD